ncbi:MAG TPA: tautomerase family protein [Thermoanaerobaculia bacterium]|nr:tautomerase family protein [Thermoanaerobaculia bacterium]
MPLVRIDVLEGRSAGELDAIGDGVHRALVEAIGIPDKDRFQVIASHAPGRLVFDTHYLGIARTPAVVFVQITLSSGRSLEQKKALFAAIARNLHEKPGLRTEDVFVNLVEVARENWSFGNGLAQYAT